MNGGRAQQQQQRQPSLVSQSSIPPTYSFSVSSMVELYCLIRKKRRFTKSERSRHHLTMKRHDQTSIRFRLKAN
jgi:hypothetical protein